jgi:hypothetical protein
VVRGERTCAGAKVVSHLFYFMIAQLKLRTPPPYHPRTFVLFPCYQLRFLSYFLFSSFLGQLVAFWRATPTYVPVTDSFAFYSTRVQYATCASIRTHTITPSPPFPYRTYTHIIDAHYIHQLFLSRYDVTNPSPKSDGCNNFFHKWDSVPSSPRNQASRRLPICPGPE